MRRRTIRLITMALAGVAMLLTLVVGAAPAGAHSGEESYVYLDIFDDEIDGRIEYPVADLGEVLDIDIPEDEDDAEAAVEANAGRILAYADEHFEIGLTADAPWPVEFGETEILATRNGTYAIVHFDVLEEFDSTPREFSVTYDGIFETKDERRGLLLIGTDWGSGTFDNENEHLLVYRPGNRTQTVDLDDSSWWRGFSAVVVLGAEHIQIGHDHILFIITLVLPSVLIFTGAGRWRPSDSFGSSLWRVLKIVTMFTVAHSITLTLGGLEIVELSPKLVEGVIAISIALAALHNLRPIFVNREWLLAFGFGLFHGFGFAGLLSDLGLDRGDRISSLLGFNLGVELGQAAIVLMLFPVLFLVRRTFHYERAMKGASIVMAIVAAGWSIERFFEVDVGVDRVVTPVLLWPRVLVFVAIGAALAVAYRVYEERRGRLLPVGEDDLDLRDDELAPVSTSQ